MILQCSAAFKKILCVLCEILNGLFCCVDTVSSPELDQHYWKSGAQWHFAWTWSLWQSDQSDWKSGCCHESGV